jgi:general secretion pathway protein J
MERQAELHDLQRTVGLLNNDFAQLRPRTIRDELGRDNMPALMSDQGREFVVELSHDGWRNPTNAPRGTLQRVQYRLEEPAVDETRDIPQEDTFVLVREYWPVMDRTLGMEGTVQELLDDVEIFTVEFLGLDGEWSEIWPPANAGTGGIGGTTLPLAVRYRVESKTFGPIERVVEVVQ